MLHPRRVGINVPTLRPLRPRRLGFRGKRLAATSREGRCGKGRHEEGDARYDGAQPEEKAHHGDDEHGCGVDRGEPSW